MVRLNELKPPKKLNLNLQRKTTSNIAVQYEMNLNVINAFCKCLLVTVCTDFFPFPRLNSHFPHTLIPFPSHSHPMADRIPIPMGIPWDPWDPGLSHPHAHLYTLIGWVVKARPTSSLTKGGARFGLYGNWVNICQSFLVKSDKSKKDYRW